MARADVTLALIYVGLGEIATARSSRQVAPDRAEPPRCEAREGLGLPALGRCKAPPDIHSSCGWPRRPRRGGAAEMRLRRYSQLFLTPT